MPADSGPICMPWADEVWLPGWAAGSGFDKQIDPGASGYSFMVSA
ncbi:hypothetical protein [uncultured Pedobacter sp.]|nr:hypothetical protein [uncultured Pedobacter sp.]